MTDERRLRVEEFAYDLPEGAIAQDPVEPRDASRLLLLDREASRAGSPALEHRHFRDIANLLDPGDLLVVNDSRVLRARLRGRRQGGGAVEILLLRPLADGRWEALVRPSRRLRTGDPVTLVSGDRVVIGEAVGEGTRAVELPRDPLAVMAEAGETPLPPYIHASTAPPDRYQTIYADPLGSAAAPTAGLHFTRPLLDKIAARGVEMATITLHVGLDTFRPLEGDHIDEHAIHREWYEVPAPTVAALTTAGGSSRRIVAVGTTSTRVLESYAATGQRTGWTDLYLTPGHRFALADALITNFHLPRSSLLVLVTAFVQDRMPGATALAARDIVLSVYRTALAEGYRFFSFGDAMLIR